MTIKANVGLPGSGKSLHSVGQEIVGALKERRLIVTNVPVKVRALSDYVGFDVTNLIEYLTEDTNNREPFSDIADFEHYDKWRSDVTKGYGPLFVIDECHKCFADVSGLKANDHPIAKWFAEHRHKGCDVLLMTQDRMAIPSAIRRRVEETYLYRKLGALGFGNRYVRLMFHGEQKEALARDFGKYKKEWFGLYYSTRAGVSERLYKAKNIFLNPRLMVILLMLIGIGVYLLTHGIHMPGSRPVKSSAAAAGGKTSAAGPDALKLVQDPQHVLTAPSEVHSAEIDALRIESEKLRLEAEVATLKKAALAPAGMLTPIDGGGTHWEATPVPRRHRLDGAQIQIASYMLMGGQSTYWLTVRQDGHDQLVTDEGLRSDGFEVSGQGRCVAILKGDHGVYRLTCDGWAIVGDKKSLEDAAPVSSFPQLEPIKLPNGQFEFPISSMQDKIPANAIP